MDRVHAPSAVEADFAAPTELILRLDGSDLI
jgi:hypothetical protein